MNNKLEKVVKLADAMYYAAQYLTTDASRLHRAMDAYHQFIITEYNKQEPESEELEDALKAKVDEELEDPVFGKLINTFAAYSFAKQIVNWHKEQMMKDAIDTRIDKRLADMIGYTGSERVKVIIIKE